MVLAGFKDAAAMEKAHKSVDLKYLRQTNRMAVLFFHDAVFEHPTKETASRCDIEQAFLQTDKLPEGVNCRYLDAYFLSEGFEHVGFEESVWVRPKGGKCGEDMYVSTHVDDCLISCKSTATMSKFKQELLT
jgi:hypothetical protein